MNFGAVRELNTFNNHHKMGGSLTMDKHTSSLDDWLSIQSKLENIEFTADINNHLVIWRVYVNELDNSTHLASVDHSAIRGQASLFIPDDCFVVGLVKKDSYGQAASSENISHLVDG